MRARRLGLIVAWAGCSACANASSKVSASANARTPDAGAIPMASVAPSASAVTPAPDGDGGASVLQHHKNATRDGVYFDAALTKAAAATMHRDPSFSAHVTGTIYAQPLYVEQGPGNQEAFIVATEQNHVTALSGTGTVLWDAADTTIGAPVSGNPWPLGCGNIMPLGITGTPVIDIGSRTIYFDAMTMPAAGTFKHLVYALSLDDGTVRPGWPIDVDQSVTGFASKEQNQRGALALVNGVLYVPYGGHDGDCVPYHGWVVGVPVANPSGARGWSTGSVGAAGAGRGGIWSAGGLASDGTFVYASTGNTSADDVGGFSAPAVWSGGEAILKFSSGPSFSGNPTDYFYPSNWASMDINDIDLGGANPVVFDMAGATPAHFVVALGKDGNLYLLDRDNLGGKGGAVSISGVANSEINGAPAVYTTGQGTYVAFRSNGTAAGCPQAGFAPGNMAVAKVTSGGTPPTASVVWCAAQSNLGSPIVTTTAAGDVIVWDANDHLYAYDGDTGALVYGGGGASDGMADSIQYFNTTIAAKGRIVAGAGNQVYVFRP